MIRDVMINLRLWGAGSAAKSGGWMILKLGMQLPRVVVK